MERTPKLETVCPGCGTTWVGSNGFASTSYDFPSNNPTSCPTHRAALELLEALERVAHNADESLMQHPDDLPAILAVTYKQVRAALKAAKGDA